MIPVLWILLSVFVGVNEYKVRHQNNYVVTVDRAGNNICKEAIK